jgi:hypothetical protein
MIISIDGINHNLAGGTEGIHEKPVRIDGVPAEPKPSTSRTRAWSVTATPARYIIMQTSVNGRPRFYVPIRSVYARKYCDREEKPSQDFQRFTRFQLA